MSVSQAHVRVGETVTVSWVTRDPDAEIGCTFGESFGDMAVSSTRLYKGTPRYGAWDPPARVPGQEADNQLHRYEESGTFTIEIHRTSGGCDLSMPNPYGSEGWGRATVVVDSDAEATTTSSPSATSSTSTTASSTTTTF